MNQQLLKEKLHPLIDQLQDKQALQKLYIQAVNLRYYLPEDDPFTEDVWKAIEEGLAQLRNEEPCTHLAAVEKFREWELGK